MATSAQYTVSTILQLIADLRGESSLNTDASRIRAVNAAYRDISNRHLWKTHLLRLQTTTGDGTGDYTIGSTAYPMREHGLSEIFVGDTLESSRYGVLDYHSYQETYNGNNADLIAYEYYDAANDVWKVHINPVVAISRTIYYSYFWTPKTLTATSDIVVIADPMAVAKAALGIIYEGEDELQKAQLAKQEVEQILTDLISQDNRINTNQYQAMNAIENASRSRGFGTY